MDIKNKNIVLGIDIDDCVCNTLEMDRACGIYYSQKHNMELTDGMLSSQDFCIPNAFQFSKEQEFDYFIKEKEFIMKNTSMYPKVFVKEVISKLKKKGFKIIFITSRDNIFWKGNAKKYAKKWLSKFKIKYNAIYANVKNKMDLCKQLKVDYMIEDNPNFVQELNKNEISTILIKTEYNKSYNHPKNIFAEDWLDLYAKLGKIYNFESNDIIF